MRSQPRQQSGMIQVRVREDHPGETRRIECEAGEIELFQLARTLEQTAVDQDGGVAVPQFVARTGHRPGRPMKG